MANSKKEKIKLLSGSSICLVVCNKEYPYKKSYGDKIKFNSIPDNRVVSVYLSGASIAPEVGFITSGGRIMSICSHDKDFNKAKENVYNFARSIEFRNIDYRKDIGL